MSDTGHVTEIRNERTTSLEDNVYYTSAMSSIVPCNQGQQVWVEMGSDARLVDISTRRNQFSGVLIKEELE